jgi:hypothetical protein
MRLIVSMRIFFVILFSSILFFQCATRQMQKSRQWKEKFRVGQMGDTLGRVSIPLGEIEKFSIELFTRKAGRDSVKFEANVSFTDTANAKNEKLYFLACSQINAKYYLPIDTILSCTRNGKYNFNLSQRDLKRKKIVVFFEDWVGYLFE